MANEKNTEKKVQDPAAKQPRKKRVASSQSKAKTAAKTETTKTSTKSSGKKTGKSAASKAAKGEKLELSGTVQNVQKAVQNLFNGNEGKNKKQYSRRGKKTAKNPVRIIPLGGLNEIGKNMTCYECGNDMFIVDCGLAFPDETMLGVDIVIPDFTYVTKNNKEKVRGIFITQGHEDLIGALPYLLKEINAPVYGTRLTIGLIKNKLKEHGLLGTVQLVEVNARDTIKAGCMSVEFIHVNHSIPDACALAIHTPVGVIIQTGDFKIDYSPIEGEIIDLARFGELGANGVLALLPDSTNAEAPGMAGSERTIGDSFNRLFTMAGDRRIIIATFASNIHRIQQIMDCAEKFDRKVAVSGRSMVNAVAIAEELGYLSIPKDLVVDVDVANRLPADRVVIITTGSQGEPMSALTRMAMSDHRKVSVGYNDFIIISARPIPGNEKLVARVVNQLMQLGAEVIYEKKYETHVSGHACQDELRLMICLTKPKFILPMHGEFKHQSKVVELAAGMGMDPDNVVIPAMGQILELDGETVKVTGEVTAGAVMVDGLGVGDVGSIVLRDRKHLAEDGLIVVVATINTKSRKLIAGPDIISRGFVYVRESEDMINQAQEIAKNAAETCLKNGIRDWSSLKQRMKDDVSRYFYAQTKRSPMILVVLQEA
ncbi:MAG: ribonuclease J [Oscillospiraceae bacterium]|nr:ribonuclease J [Oscillospiraceae bacterium]